MDLETSGPVRLRHATDCHPAWGGCFVVEEGCSRGVQQLKKVGQYCEEVMG